ncbi:filamentous hemagglutinin N-terminal domain-containing protein [Ferrovibrio sp.]|uniref:two-partner secretion domain-containing protein n=1 Tax=Ferrovibrio sp. TaxID=1917215 RepID=UPI0025C09060|nr:filamentous hemagglutinin N-terminal domain-containing protein [Ferrovibrio sp.]MBX3452909.1 filamentous hemagglutinin N-terminal domain-containing protein [Ferrovibrio sp.]
MRRIKHWLLICSALMLPLVAQAQVATNALPTGGSVVAGTATITQSGARMDVTQSTQSGIINWQSFNIGSQAWVNFNQPSSNAATLNRVTGGSVSEILGKLTANGQVFLVNPSGIVFGRDAQINVGGLVASTMSIRDDDFMAENYRFQRNGSTGQIINQGSLTATERGYIALLAPDLRNEGLISARLGSVALAAGETVVMQIGQNLSLQVEPATVQALIDNRAMVVAEGGRVILTAKALDTLTSGAINTSGVIRADSLVERGGEIVLEASGALTIGGTVSANGTSGGTITANAGGAITLTDASVTADGNQGAGGSMAIGNWGSASLVVNAGSTFSASAGQNGDGGSITFFSQDTRFSGQARARGGSLSGDGGFIETSGILLDIGNGAAVDASAANGRAGTWLLDPNDLTIGVSGASALSTALATTNVTLNTSGCPSSYASCAAGNGDVFINSSITPTVTAVGGTIFKVQADGGISLADNTSIAATSGSNALAVQFQAGASGGIYIGSNSSIITRGGGVNMTGGGTSSTAQGVAGSNGGRGLFINGSIINAGGGSMNLRGKGADNVANAIGIDIASGSQISTTGSGQIELTGIGGDSTGGTNAFSSGINFGSGAEISTGSGAITVTGTQAGTSTNPAYGISFEGGAQQTAIYSTSGGIGFTASGGKIGFSTPNGGATVALGWDGVSSSPTTSYVNLTASDVQLDSTNTTTLKAANINIRADSLGASNTTTVTASTQATIYPSTLPGSIGIGTGAGLLNISDAVLRRFQTSTLLNIGTFSSGAVTIGGTLTAFTTPVRIMSNGTITLDNGASISSSASGTAITLSGVRFTNNGGSINATAGRWLVRTSNPANDTRGALTGFERYSCSSSPSVNCSNLPATGNGFTYSVAGTDVGGFSSSSSSSGGSSSGNSVADQARRTQASTDGASLSRDVENTVQTVSLPISSDGRPRLADLRSLGESPLTAIEFGYSISNLRAAGYSVEELRAAGIPLADIKAGRYSPVYVKEAGYSIGDMLAAGYGIKDLGAAGYSLAELKSAGVPLSDLRASGYGLADLRAAGFTASDFVASGWSVDDLWQQGYPVSALRREGFSALDLQGIPPGNIVGAGYSVADLHGAGIPASTLRDLGYSLVDLADAGYAPDDLLKAGFPAAELDAFFAPLPEPARPVEVAVEKPAEPRTPPAMPQASPAAPVVAEVSTTTDQLPPPASASFNTVSTTPSAKEVEFNEKAAYLAQAMEQRAKNLAPPAVWPTLPDIDYSKASLGEILAAIDTPEFAALSAEQRSNYPAIQEIIRRGEEFRATAHGQDRYDNPLNVAMTAVIYWLPGAPLKGALGWANTYVKSLTPPIVQSPAAMFAQRGIWQYTGASNEGEFAIAMVEKFQKENAGLLVQMEDMKSGKWQDQLNNATAEQMAKIMEEVANTDKFATAAKAAIDEKVNQASEEIKNTLASETDRLKAGMAQMAEAAREQHNTLSRQVLAVQNKSVRDLIDSGVSLKHMLEIGYVDLQTLATAKVNAAELRAAGVSLASLSAAGVSPAALQQMGFSTSEMLQSGLSLSDIPASVIVADARHGRVSADELLKAGINPAKLRSMGFGPNEMRTAGFPIETLRANYSASALREAGFSAATLRQGGASAASLLSAGYSVENLRAAGFSSADLSALGA